MSKASSVLKKGRKSIENNPNEVCRLCNDSLRVKYGSCGIKSCLNLFKSTERQGYNNIVLADSLRVVGLVLENQRDKSQVVCKPCAGKIRTLCTSYEFVSSKIAPSSSNVQIEHKRKASAIVTPERSSPGNRKAARLRSPAKHAQSRKSLFSSSRPESDNVQSSLNIDDLDNSEGCAVKVLIAYPSGNVQVKSKFDDESLKIIKYVSLCQWKTVVNCIFRHQFLRLELLDALEREVSREIKEYSKSDCCLKYSEPDQLATFKNTTLCQELRVLCPLFNTVVRGACGLPQGFLGKPEELVNERAVNAVALATSALVRCRNRTLSAVAYRISLVLFHSGVSFQDCLRLNHLGVCMSPAMTIALHQKMNKTHDYQVIYWKRQIEENKSIDNFLTEVLEKQTTRASDDDMELEILLDLSEEFVKAYKWYMPTVYKGAIDIISKANKLCSVPEKFTEEEIRNAIASVRGCTLPYYKIVADNIDHNILARIQTSELNNRSIHWTHQYAIKDKVTTAGQYDTTPQKSVDDLQLIELLPNGGVLENLASQWAILVSRVITTYLPAFKQYQKDVVYHIPHNYSKEMSSKSEICSLGMEFYNPNVSADMTQILKNYQEKYVPCFVGNNKEVLCNVPLHGDQLFEERARNVQCTFRVEESKYDKLSSLLPEHADWHAKLTMYKIESDIFVKDTSAGELGTSRASMNRTSKTNAAKGVHNHYNEVKEFHSRELEAHICASFMHMCNMPNINGEPQIPLPDQYADKQTRMKWLFDLCKNHVEKFVLRSGVPELVQETEDLERRLQGDFYCRHEGCNKAYKLHSRRVRHELEDHNLNLQLPVNDERDEYGYYFCRNECGLVFKTKSTRNRHERQFHPDFVPQTPAEQEDATDETKSESKKPKEDYLFNYHQSKLAFGMLIMAMEDAIKEGDGQRLHDIYKVALLFHKSNNHYKYAYVTLLYLVKLTAILPKFEAERLKWNRFVNNHGGKGSNIPLDLKKEHQNHLLKTMWRALGPNLNEKNAARLAGTLDGMEQILYNIDQDCKLNKRPSHRSNSGKEEAVTQIVEDLISIDAFKQTLGRNGHPSFPQFSSNLVSGVDFRDLHKWIKEKLKQWGSIYQ